MVEAGGTGWPGVLLTAMPVFARADGRGGNWTAHEGGPMIQFQPGSEGSTHFLPV